MERSRGGTTAGVPVWTPAPLLSSPSSLEGSDFSWDEEPDMDFQSQMDENGIIGLAESQGQQEREEGDIGEELLWDVKTPEPEHGPPTALEEISCHLSELLDSEPPSQATEDHYHSLSLQEEHGTDDDQSVSVEDWTDDEGGTRNQTIQSHRLNSFPERVSALDMTNEETEEKDICEDARRFMDQTFPLTEIKPFMFETVKTHDFTQERTGFFRNLSISEILECSDRSDSEELRKTDERCLPIPLCSPRNAPNPIHFLNLSSEDLMNDCGIEAETFPELEIRSDSSLSPYQSAVPEAKHTCRSNKENKHKMAPQTSARSPVMRIQLEKTPQDGTSGEKLDGRLCRPYHNLQPSTASPRKTTPASCNDRVYIPAQCISKASVSPSKRSPPPTPAPRRFSALKNHRNSKTSYMDVNDIRKGQLSHTLPDFSKVEPKVRFPKKSEYKPPESRKPHYGKTSHPDLPVLFKSPAEIVKEVLLSSSDGSLGSSSSGPTQMNLANRVPEEFRCPLEASTLMQQLQEDYNRLLTKYAEAENTIDRLRLEAKVGFSTELPKPSTAVLSGVIQEGSKVITLSFPQAQRAEFGAGSVHLTQQKELTENSRKAGPRPSSVSSISSRRSGSLTADHLTDTLTKQTQRFQLQFDAFEELVKNGKLKPCEQIKGLSTLSEGQECLERAYLDTRGQFQILQQRQGGHVMFDQDRDLEGQIFRSGMRLEELKEWLEQIEQSRPLSEPTLSPLLPSDVLSASMLESEPMPESPLSAVYPEACVGVEVSSVSGESDGDREEEEILPLLLHPLRDKHQRVEKDFSELMDCYQRVKELPGMLDQTVTLKSHDLLDFGSFIPPENKGVMDRQPSKIVSGREITKPSQQQSAADCVPPSGPSVSSQVCDSMETHLEAFCHSSILPGESGRGRKAAGNQKTQSSSLTSLEERTNHRTIGLKAKAKTLREPPLDGVMSPETDSGFMGSVSSQLTPVLHSPLQQGAMPSSIGLSDPQKMKHPERPESAPPPGQPFVVSPSHSQPSPKTPEKHLGTAGSDRRRGGEESCSYSSLSSSISPLPWPNSGLRPWMSSPISQSERGSDEAEGKSQNSQHPQPANQKLRSHRSPSPHVPYHHSPVQLTNHQVALQSLQEEVNRLEERLKGNLRLSKPGSPARVPSSATEDTRGHTHPQTSTTQQLELRVALQSLQQEVNRLKERLKGNLSLSKPASPVRVPSSATEDTRGHTHPQTSTTQRVDLGSSTRRRRQTERHGNGEKERKNPPRPILRQRSASLPRHQPKIDLTSDSEHALSEPRPSTSRHVPVFPLKSRGRRQTRGFEYQKEDSTSGRSDNSDETEPSRGPKSPCPNCRSDRIRSSIRPTRSRSSPHLTQTPCSHCPLCGASKANLRATKTANQVPVSTPRWSQPMTPVERDGGGINVAVAPSPLLHRGFPVVPYVPLYPSTLYFSSPVTQQAYTQPYNMSSSPVGPERSGDRGHRRRSLFMEPQQNSVSSSLTRAISAARHMREVSQRMASSLRTTSCTY